MSKQRACLSMLLAVMMLVAAPVSQACIVPVNYSFSWTLHPALPVSNYCAGKLGVILPSFARSYLLVAYRYLSGKPLTQQEQQIVNKFVKDRLDAQWTDDCDGNADQSWLKVRNSVPGVLKIDSIEPSRAVGKEMSWSVYCNCQKSGFDTAAGTLTKRINEFTAASPLVKEWIAAQDLVFANCSGQVGGAAQIPAALPSDAPKIWQQDRAYQIAAAYFYAQQFDKAQAEFARIAADRTSPWSTVSRYLQVRALIRQGTLIDKGGFDKAVLAKADDNIGLLLADPSMYGFRDALLALQSFVRSRVAPETRLQDLGKTMSQTITAQLLDDYIHTFDNVKNADSDQSGISGDYQGIAGDDDLTDWIITFQTGGAESLEHALNKWRTTQSPPWLLCALAKIDSSHELAGSLLQAAGRIDSSSAGYASMAFYRAVLLMKQGRLDEAGKVIAEAAALPQLDLPSRNLFQTLRVQLAGSLQQFLGNSLAMPAGIWGGGQDEVPWAEGVEKPTTWFLSVAQRWLDRKMPLVILRQAAVSPVLPAFFRNQLAQCVWVRAVLLGDDAGAQQLASVLKTSNKKLGSYYNAYANAKTPAARKFAAAFLMLHNDESDPSLASMHESGEHWWWSTLFPEYSSPQEDILAKYENVIRPGFITAAQVRQGEQECKRLKKVAPPGTYLPEIVVSWAKANPGDPRVPEALHLAVRCTRYAVKAEAQTNWSQEAFQILHRKYPKSPWVQKTKYWY